MLHLHNYTCFRKKTHLIFSVIIMQLHNSYCIFPYYWYNYVVLQLSRRQLIIMVNNNHTLNYFEPHLDV